VVLSTAVAVTAGGVSALAVSPATASVAVGSRVSPVPKGTVHPDPVAPSETDLASHWSLPTVTFPVAATVTVPVSASSLSSAGSVSVADPAALGTLGLPSLSTGGGAQPDGLPAPAGLSPWQPDTTSAAPSSVQVRTLGDDARTQLGQAPMVFTVARADGMPGQGPVAVSVNYSGFRDAFGGNYAERLDLVRYPACVLTTPDLPGCSTGAPVANQVNNPYRNALTAIIDADDPAAGSQGGAAPTPSQSPTDLPTASPTQSPTDAPTMALVAADRAVVLPTPTPTPTDSSSPSPSDSPSGASSGSVFVVTSSASGPSGTYIASPLLPSAHWSVGLSSGSLGYSYPVDAPTPPGGGAPDVALSYDSGSVDGRTSVTNPQASWLGMGWDYEPGFVEREYDSCDRHGHTNQDLCYVTSPLNVTLSLNGSTMHLVKDADGTWRVQDDPGWIVSDATGASNGDATGEYWKLQSPDGTTYYFGRGVGVSGTAATSSAWTVPVFGYPGTVCSPAGAFTSCNKAWRWNLDYVVDRHRNETTYTYTQELNAYNVNGLAPAKNYARGGRLASITYGLRDGDTGTPVEEVNFAAVLRCTAKQNGATTTCPTLGPANASSYPDVPTDLICVNGSTTCTQKSPSFFTTSMLSTIDTFVLTSSGDTYDQIDGYALQYQFPDPDGSGPESPALWLSQVQRTGDNGTAVSTPPMKMTGVALANRFDVVSGVSPVDMYRVNQILNESGGRLDMTYGTPDPCTTTLENGDHSNNTLDCFPVHWVPQGSSTWAAGWFNKYLVTRTGQYVPYLNEFPHTTGRGVTSEPMVTDYIYANGAAWHKNSFEVNPTLNDSWNVYRGYTNVVVHEDQVSATVVGSSYESVTTHRFYRGMYGDLNNDGTTKTNTVTTTAFGTVNDYDYLAGREAEVIVQTSGSTIVSTTDTNFWTRLTASMTMPTPNPVEVAEEVRPAGTEVLQTNVDGTTRAHEIFDVHNPSTDPRDITDGAIITHVDDGDLSGPDPEAYCTSISYVASSSRYLLEPASITTHAGTASGANCQSSTTLLAHREFFYDQTSSSTTAPTVGDVRRTQTQLTASTFADTYATYDAYGRTLTATDADGHVTTTAYSPTTGTVASVTVTSPVVHPLGSSLSTTTQLDLRGMARQSTDANGNLSTNTYDALGRLTAAFAPTETAGTAPTFTAAYHVNQTAWSTVETKNLINIDGTGAATYRDTWTYLDGWQRTREVHTPVFNDSADHLTVQTRYTDTGQIAATTSPYLNTGALNSGADYTNGSNVPLEVDYGYDAAHRLTNSARTVNGAQNYGRTLIYFHADQILTTPPAPAPATTASIDVWGRPLVSTESSQVSGDASTSATTYGYDPLGRLASVADDAGKTNHYSYDLAGRRINATDADTGASTAGYDPAGNVTGVTDALGTTVSTTYDELNRPLTVSSNGHTSPSFPAGALVDYTYDAATLGKGLAASTTVHDLGNATGDWTTSVSAYDADGRPTSTTYTLPAVSGQTSGSIYTFGATYKPDGQTASVSYPVIGDRPAETVGYGYETGGGVTGLPISVTGPITATGTYTSLDQLATRTLGAAGAGQTVRSYGYTDPLRRLSSISTTANTGSAVTVQNDAYSYDNVNNPTQVVDSLTTQQTCYSYDGLDRLKTAWTENASCASYTATTADGPAGFNAQYAYAANGVPTSVTNLGAATTYAAGDTSHPHAITGFGANSYSYDIDGQQTSRTVSGVASALSWDPLHLLYRSVAGTATTSYVDAPDGTRIARLDPDGSTTIWLAGNELRVASGVTTATRYYSFGGATIGLRNADGLTWLGSDGQNSRQLAVNASDGSATRSYYTPYGAVRSGASLLPTDQNFLGRVRDSTTGLVQDGARYYDPSIGQFLTPDPLVNTTDSKTLDPYGYAANNPAAFADPTGMVNDSMGGGGCGSLSISQCAAQELGDLSMADLLASGGGTDTGAGKNTGASTAGKVGGDAADIGVQAVNDTKDAPTGALNGIKNFFASLFGGAEAAACGSSCEATAAQTGSAPPFFGPEDTPDIPSGPDIPLPFKFQGPKILLTGGGYIASLLLGGAFGKLGKLAIPAEAGAGADNVVNGLRLRAQLTGDEIAGGHAFDKHVIELGEFPGITTREQFARTIEDVVTNGEMRPLSNGRTGYWYDGTVVIRNPGAVDGGTAFRPTDGYDYFINTLH
jgi:RHS repeat-associated protein